jgi:tripartite-type tricarboxylate transporter receptor subunit TctC
MMISRRLTAAATLALAALVVTAPRAQDYPAKDINYIIAFSPGGESDVTARLQEPVLRQLTGHSFTIQYRTGGGGATAWSQLNTCPTSSCSRCSGRWAIKPMI